MIRPDPREFIWYDLNNVLNLDADSMPHYWTILFDKFKLIDDNDPRPICLKCGSQDFVNREGKVYCANSIYVKSYDEDGNPDKVLIEEGHQIINETMRATIIRMSNDVFDMLEDMDGYKMDLFELEDYMWGRADSAFFETKQGDIRKSEVKREFSRIKDVLVNRLIELRSEIRFGANMRTPSIKM